MLPIVVFTAPRTRTRLGFASEGFIAPILDFSNLNYTEL
jgi:hypothetical protein